MNNSIRAIIDRALDDTEYPADAYNTAEHVDTQFDDDIEKLASALDFLGGNLNNIGTPEEKLLELYEFNKLANEAIAVEGATGGAAAGGATAGAGGAGAAAAGTEAAADAAAAGPKNPYKNSYLSRGKHVAFAQGAEAGITHGMERGRLSADALQGVKNTWNSGAGGKAALIGTGLGVLGAGALLGGAMSKSSHFTGDFMYDDDNESFLGAGFNPYAYEAYEMEKAASYGLSYEEYEMLKEAAPQWVSNLQAGFTGSGGAARTQYATTQRDATSSLAAVDKQMKDLRAAYADATPHLSKDSPYLKGIRKQLADLAKQRSSVRGTLSGLGAAPAQAGFFERMGARIGGRLNSPTHPGTALERPMLLTPEINAAVATDSPVAAREAAKEITEGGAGAASKKPGLLSRHGGKLAIGAGVIGLGGLGYAAMRNRRRD